MIFEIVVLVLGLLASLLVHQLRKLVGKGELAGSSHARVVGKQITKVTENRHNAMVEDSTPMVNHNERSTHVENYSWSHVEEKQTSLSTLYSGTGRRQVKKLNFSITGEWGETKGKVELCKVGATSTPVPVVWTKGGQGLLSESGEWSSVDNDSCFAWESEHKELRSEWKNTWKEWCKDWKRARKELKSPRKEMRSEWRPTWKEFRQDWKEMRSEWKSKKEDSTSTVKQIERASHVENKMRRQVEERQTSLSMLYSGTGRRRVKKPKFSIRGEWGETTGNLELSAARKTNAPVPFVWTSRGQGLLSDPGEWSSADNDSCFEWESGHKDFGSEWKATWKERRKKWKSARKELKSARKEMRSEWRSTWKQFRQDWKDMLLG